jgi:hypothetical protein
MSKKQAIAIGQTILTQEMSTKVDEEDYIYYKVEDGVRPPKDSYHFEPSEEDMVLSPGTKHWQRLIFPEQKGYYEYEEEIYQQFQEHVEEQGLVLPPNVTKSAAIRFLQANHYKVKKAVDDILSHLEWRKTTLPIILTSTQKLFLDEGLFYVHGRDRNYRPLNVFDPRVIIGKTADRDEVIMIVHFVFQYIIDNMLIPGKVENWISLMDLSNLSISQLPKKWLTSFIKSCQANYKCRGVKSFVLNASWGIRAVWKMASPFVDSKVKQKISFQDGNKCEELVDMFHPSQLEKKFGGEAPNLDVYWPPHEVSKEYGVDQSKINRPEYDGSADLHLDDEGDSVFDLGENESPGILRNSITFNNKLNPQSRKPVKVEEIKLDEESQQIEGTLCSNFSSLSLIIRVI